MLQEISNISGKNSKVLECAVEPKGLKLLENNIKSSRV